MALSEARAILTLGSAQKRPARRLVRRIPRDAEQTLHQKGELDIEILSLVT
jgi:hypothetical protein